MAVNVDSLVAESKKYYTDVMDEKLPSTSEQKYTDLNDWLAQQYPAQDAAKLKELENKLKDLYTKCLGVVGVADQSLSDVYPPYPTSGIMNMKLHIWKLGFTADSFIRGSTAAYNVMMVMEKDLQDGGKTEKYPIEVLPFVTGKTPGQAIESFEIMTSIGASVVTSAYLVCLWVIEKGYFDVAGQGVQELVPLANIILSIMRVNTVHEHIKDLKDAAFKSNKGKIEAAQRPKPTILALAHSYSRVATDILSQKKSRKTQRELVMEQVFFSSS